MPKPGELWVRLRALGGVATEGLPSSFELLAAVLLDLPALAASSLDASQPAYAALLAPAKASPTWVTALRLSDGREFVARLATGAEAEFTASASSVHGLTLLGKKRGTPRAFGVLSNYLLVAERAADVENVAPYLVRNLARRPLPAQPFVAEFNEAALAGPLSTLLSGSWHGYQQSLRELDRAQRDVKGRAPDFADPGAVLAAADEMVQSLTALVQTTRRARLSMAAEGPALGLSLRLELEPKSGGFAERSIADLAVGDLRPLFALPAQTGAALLMRTAEAERKRLAHDAGLGLAPLFGTRLPEKDRDKLRQVLSRFHEGRGEATVYGLLPERTLFVATDAAQPDVLRQAFAELDELSALPPIKAALKDSVGDFAVQPSKADISGISLQRLTFRPTRGATRRAIPDGGIPGGGRKAPADFGAAPWSALFGVRERQAFMTLGPAADSGFAALLAAAGDSALGADRELQALAAPVGESVSFALYVNLARFGLVPDPSAAAPALLVLRRQGSAAWLELQCGPRAASALARSLGQGR